MKAPWLLVPRLLLPGMLLLASATPFWEAKPPAQWTVEEAQSLLFDSPWAMTAQAGKDSLAAPVWVYVASAEPAILAEDRLRSSRKSRDEDPSWTEYREYLTENAGKYIVIAIGGANPRDLLDNSETRRVEDESRLRIGKRKYKIVGHFPPSSTDPFVRLVFPRDLQPGDRSLAFEVYVPGTGAPYRQVEFRLKDMVYRGHPSY
jgi:hypothetical protein